MGTGCETVRRIKTDGSRTWLSGSGRTAASGPFGIFAEEKTDSKVVIYGTEGTATANSSGYGPLLVQIDKFFQTGEAPVPAAETIEIFRVHERRRRIETAGGRRDLDPGTDSQSQQEVTSPAIRRAASAWWRPTIAFTFHNPVANLLNGSWRFFNRVECSRKGIPMITRRRFFEESMIAAAVAVSSSGTRSLLAAETGNASANDTLRHAVIGCRIRGRVHAREFARQEGVEVAYVCDPDRTLADELATAVEEQQARRPKAVSDLRTIFDDQSVDTVSIATPNHWHALAAVWAMQAGKDVYVEKPVSHNIVEGRRMVQAAEATGRLCQSGTQRRSSGGLVAAAEFIRQGKLGEVNFARSIIYGGRGSIGARGRYEVPAQIDYNLWLGPAPMTKLTRPRLHYDWHWDWATGNGELGNNNIHIIDTCRMLMGLTGLGKSVISIGGRLGYKDAGETPNTQIVAHEFDGVTIVQEVRGLKTDPYSEQFKAGWIVHGTEGFVAEESLFDRDGKLVQTFQGRSENHFANFIKAVRSGKRTDLNADIVEGHQSTSLCHVGNISYRVGRPLPVEAITAFLEKQSLHDDVPRTFARTVEHLRARGVDLNESPLILGELLKIDDESGIIHRSCRRKHVAGENLPQAVQAAGCRSIQARQFMKRV